MTSQSRMDANRANSSQSTGPRDTERTRFNATRHGILSNETLIRRGEGAEDPKVFEELRRGLYESLAPVGEFEILLVDELVLITWRRRRVVRYETAAIRLSTELAMRNHASRPNLSSSSPASERREEADAILDEFLPLIEVVRRDPQPDDPDVASSFIPLFEFVDREFDSPVESVLGLSGGWANGDTYSAADVLKVIQTVVSDAHIELSEFWVRFEADLNRRVEAAQRVLMAGIDTSGYALQLASLPVDPAMDRIQRYEGHLSRLFYRALHELERLQAIRFRLATIEPSVGPTDDQAGG